MKQINQAVATLIRQAAVAGNKNPSINQLKTLAVALGDQAAARFFVSASIADLVAVRKAIAAIVNGEEPKTISDGVGGAFGMSTPKESKLPSEEQDRIYTPKPVSRTTEEQKDINARKKIEQEDKQPLTSDRATRKPAVDAPLKEKTDPKFKKILDRGAGHLDEIAKETQPKKAGLKNPYIAANYETKEDPTTDTLLDGCTATDCEFNTGGTEGGCMRQRMSVFFNNGVAECLFYGAAGTTASLSTNFATYANRIKKGESVEKVFADLSNKLRKASFRPLARRKSFAVINSGDRISMDTATTGPVDVTFEDGNMTAEGEQQLMGKDPAGNVIMILPKGTDPLQIKDSNG